MSFKTTNVLESVMAQVEQRTGKVDYWKTSDQKQRWLATALLDIEPRPWREGRSGPASTAGGSPTNDRQGVDSGVIFTGALPEFQRRKGLTHLHHLTCCSENHFCVATMADAVKPRAATQRCG